MVFVPGLYVEGEECCILLADDRKHSSYDPRTSKECQDSLPTHSQVLRRCEDEAFERCIDSVDAVIEELSQWTTLVCSTPVSLSVPALMTPMIHDPRLTAIHRIKSLIHEQSNRPTSIYPRRTIRVQRRIIPQQRQDINNDETKSQQGDQVRRHPHRKTFYDEVRVEWFEDVAGQQGVVDSAVFVFFEVGELLLTDVDHLDGGCCSRATVRDDETAKDLVVDKGGILMWNGWFCCLDSRIPFQAF